MPLDFHKDLEPILFEEDTLRTIEFLQERNLLAKSQICDRCHSDMKFRKYPTKDLYGWVCGHKVCKNAKKSLRIGSWFSQMRIPIQKIVHLIHLWSNHNSVASASTATGVSERAIIQNYQYLRNVCSGKLMSVDEKLGGPGIVVQIDESLFRHKYQRGSRPASEQWVLGIADTSYKPAKVHMEMVASRNAETVLPIIRRKVAAGSIIRSDQWRAYQGLGNDVAYTYEPLNHSENVVDPVTGVHTQSIESYWNDCKRRLKTASRTKAEMLPGYLDQFMWENQFNRNKDGFENILLHMSEQYPV